MAYPDGHAPDNKDLTPAEADILRRELATDPAGRGYAGKEAQEQADLVNGTWVTKNEPPARIPRASCSKHEFAVFMGTAMGKILGGTANPDGSPNPVGQQLFGKWSNIKNTLLPFVDLQNDVPVGSKTIGDLVKSLVADHVVLQEDADALTTESDPAWQPETIHASRASLLFTDPPLYLTASDIEGLSQ